MDKITHCLTGLGFCGILSSWDSSKDMGASALMKVTKRPQKRLRLIRTLLALDSRKALHRGLKEERAYTFHPCRSSKREERLGIKASHISLVRNTGTGREVKLLLRKLYEKVCGIPHGARRFLRETTGLVSTANKEAVSCKQTTSNLSHIIQNSGFRLETAGLFV